jgi:hypothetical protein
MHTIVPWLLVLALLPRVENPWPETIGLNLPFVTGTAGAALAGVVRFRAAQDRRERAILLGGFVGFLVGAVLYLISLAAQVASSL